jgi:hypothetical protein
MAAASAPCFCLGAQERAAFAFGAPAKRRAARIRPAQRVAVMDDRHFPKVQDAPPENPGPPANPKRRMRVGRFAGVCFLLVSFSLHKQRKVTRATARKRLIFTQLRKKPGPAKRRWISAFAEMTSASSAT